MKADSRGFSFSPTVQADFRTVVIFDRSLYLVSRSVGNPRRLPFDGQITWIEN
jgi:hypothetical protein